MDNPWASTKDENNISSTDSTSFSQGFDNNFCPADPKDVASTNTSSFQPLPDSESYLANLETKLGKLHKKSTSSGAEKKDLLLSLAGAREGHIDRLLNAQFSQWQGICDNNHFDNPVEESLSGTVIRHIAPHLQAVSTGELVHLLKADQLQEATDYWNKKTFALVTGASRGIGRTLAEKIAKQIAPESVLLLISRDEKSLGSLKQAIETDRPAVRVYVGVTDLSTCDESALNGLVSSALAGDSAESFAHALCIHNVGSLGDATKRCSDLTQTTSCVDYFRLNVASVVVLNAIFLRHFASGKQQRKTVVNMSSLCAVEPFASLSLYCTGKAARDMFFKVLAKEEPEVRVLNYAPGPVETSMRSQLLDQSWIDEIKSGGLGLTTTVTCDRLMALLARDSYASGAHVDYYDS
ncbi:Sepiapterin reductase [Daphnia magna]|uniref:Sepiapterin reductase n=1 Tax=Daphnia magna TaxID=35525 RepID=A0A164RXF6_9CRUS|nr:Sepiapterin reductase [Daphnia magna]